MPKLPDVRALGPRPTQRPERAIALQGDVSGPFEAAMEGAEVLARTGRSIATLGRTLGEIGDKARQNTARAESGAARSAVLQADVINRSAIPTEVDDYTRWGDEYRERMGEALDDALGGVTSNAARAELEADFALVIERGAVAMQSATLVREADAGVAALRATLAASVAAAAAADDALSREAIFDAANDAIQNTVDNRWINDEQAGIFRRTFAENYSITLLSGMQPVERLAALRGGMGVDEDGIRTFEMTGGPVDLIPYGKRLAMLEATEDELAASEVVIARSSFLQRDVSVRAQLPAQGGDPATWDKTYRETMVAAMQSSAALISDPNERKVFVSQSMLTIESGAAALAEVVLARQGDAARADLNELITNATEAALASTDPGEQAKLLGHVETAIENRRVAGRITDVEAERSTRGLYENFAVSLAESFNAEERIAVLSEGMSTEGGRRTFSETGAFVDNIPAGKRIDMIEAAERELGARQSARHAVAVSMVNEIDDVLLAGDVPNPADLEAVKLAVSGFPDLQARLDELEVIGGTLAELQRLEPVMVQAVINGLASEPKKTPAQTRMLGAANRMLNSMNSALKDDPLSWGARAGLFQLEPFNPADPASVEKRVQAAMTVAEVYFRGNPTDVGPMTREEADLMARAWRADDAANRMLKLGQLADMNMPRDMLEEVVQTISEDTPVMGMLADMTRDDPEVVREILAGMEFLAINPGVHHEAFSENAGDELHGYIGGALITDNSGDSRAATLEAAKALFTHRRQQKGKDLAKWDRSAKNDFKQALKDVIGDVGERNHQNYITPRGYTESDFNLWLRALRDPDLHYPISGDIAQGTHGPYRQETDMLVRITADEVREAMLYTVGDGEYWLAYRVGDDIQYALTVTGDVYVLDFRQLMLAAAPETEPEPAPAPATRLERMSEVS